MAKLIQFLLILTSTYLVIRGMAEHLNPNLAIEALLPRIIKEHFSLCSIMLTYDKEHSNFTEKIMAIKETLTIEQELDTYLINFMTFDVIPPVVFPSRLGAISRLRENCVVSLIFIDEVKIDTFDRLYNLLIPHNFEVSKKDEDYYIFYTHQKDMHRVLLSDGFGMKLKYKILAFRDEMDDQLRFATVCFYCNPGRFGKQKVVPVHLDLQNNRIPTVDEIFPDYVRKFNGKEMRIVVATGTHQQARIRPDPDNPGKYLVWRGSYFHVLDHLQEIFNFTYTVRPSTGGGTGLRLENGTWVGTTGDVYNNNADIGMVTAVTYQRYRYVSYSYSLSWEWLTFAVAVPSPEFSWKAIFWPFDLVLWMYVLITMIIIILALSLLSRILLRIGGKRRWWTAGEFILGTFLEQGFDLPERVPLRIITFCWLMFSLIIGTAYRSKLVTALAFPVTIQPPETFKELADSGWGVGLCYVGGAAYSVFKSSDNPTYVKLANTFELFTDMTDCFVSTLSGKRGCIGYDSMANYVMAKNLTDRRGRRQVIVSPQASTFFVACGFVITKRAIFRLNFDRYIMTWDDMALITKWRQMDFESVRKARQKWEDDAGIKPPAHDEMEGETILNIASLKAVFFLLVTGLIVAAIAFIGEVTRHQLKQLKEKVKVKVGKIKSRQNTVDVDG